MREKIFYLSVGLTGLLGTSAYSSPIETLRCVQELKTIRADDGAPLEFQAGLAIGSAALKGANLSQSKLFLVNERGVFVFPIRSGKMTALQVEMPDPDPRRLPRLLFISYSQSDIYGSRLLTIDWDLPPHGRTPSQFKRTEPLAIGSVQSQRLFEQIIAEELKRLSDLYKQGLLTRSELLAGNLSLCRQNHSQDPVLARWLNNQIGELELISRDSHASTRLPASIGN